VNNKQWTLARTPTGGLPTDEDFKLVETPMPKPAAGQMLTHTVYLSLDTTVWQSIGRQVVGEVIQGGTVSQVVESNLTEYQEGDFVLNTNGWQEYGLTGEGIPVSDLWNLRKLDPALAPISTALGVMGMLGLTAYVGMVLQCRPQVGETVVVSAASGGVGQIAGQLAKMGGSRVVGITSTQEKCDFVTGVLGFDACVSHRSASLSEDLRTACPQGIDAYFENVGGDVFTSVLPLLNQKARVSLCGLSSLVSVWSQVDQVDAWMAQGKPTFDRQNVEAYNLNVDVDQEAPFLELMAGWIKEGKIKYKEDLWPGLEQAPKALRAMLEGANFGKTLVGVGEDPTLDESLKARRAGANVLAG
jgi:NADPH-dependent curcumin reductase CurA